MIWFVRPHLDYGDTILTNQVIKGSLRKLKEFNTIPPLLQLRLPSKEHLRVGCTAN